MATVLDDRRKASIENALQEYRDVVLARNLKNLELLIADAEVTPNNLPPHSDNEEHIQCSRLTLFSDFYRITHEDDNITKPRDMLEHGTLQKIIERNSLDGVDHGPIDGDKVAKWLETINAAIANPQIQQDDQELHTAMAELAVEARSLHLPREFQYLTTLVPGICGPGLPEYRDTSSFSLFDPEAMDLSISWKLANTVVVPSRERELGSPGWHSLDGPYIWEDWDIAIAVHPGDGPRSASGPWMLYCRRAGDEHSKWQWRYGERDEIDYQSELFDTLEEFLAFYARSGEQTEEKDNLYDMHFDLWCQPEGDMWARAESDLWSESGDW